ncbi:MAG TPA: DUF3052 domain-containing protein [Planctomycetota bacterium]|jgi:hypothetical protein
MNPVLKKLLYKGQSPVLLLQAPAEFKEIAKDFAGPVHTAPKGKYAFVLAFAKSLADADALAPMVADALEEKALFWMAYPKGTSKKYKKADINRDTLHALMAKSDFDGVSLVALDEDWSAMRFKPKA